MDVSGARGWRGEGGGQQRAAAFHPNSLTGEVGIMEGGWGL